MQLIRRIGTRDTIRNYVLKFSSRNRFCSNEIKVYLLEVIFKRYSMEKRQFVHFICKFEIDLSLHDILILYIMSKTTVIFLTNIEHHTSSQIT